MNNFRSALANIQEAIKLSGYIMSKYSQPFTITPKLAKHNKYSNALKGAGKIGESVRCMCYRYCDGGTVYEMGRCWRCGKHYTELHPIFPFSELCGYFMEEYEKNRPLLFVQDEIACSTGNVMFYD